MAHRSKSPRDRPSVSPRRSPSGRYVGRIMEREALNGRNEGSSGSSGLMKGMQIKGYLGRR